jgi:hypothetical protein
MVCLGGENYEGKGFIRVLYKGKGIKNYMLLLIFDQYLILLIGPYHQKDGYSPQRYRIPQIVSLKNCCC